MPYCGLLRTLSLLMALVAACSRDGLGSSGPAEANATQIVDAGGVKLLVDALAVDLANDLAPQIPTCTDGSRNGTETDIDCGGPSCPPCATGRACTMAGDCLTDDCLCGVCALVGGCADGLMDGSETDIDCGGRCPPCGGGGCRTGADCQSGACAGGRCDAPKTWTVTFIGGPALSGHPLCTVTSVAAADLNHDGVTDIVSGGGCGAVSVFLATRSPPYFALQPAINVGISEELVATADFDRDGLSDLVVADGATGDVTFLHYAGGALPVVFNTVLGLPTSQGVAIADFNLDHAPDLALSSPSASEVTVLLYGATIAKTTLHLPGHPVAIAAADFSCDGTPDLMSASMDSPGGLLFASDSSGAFAATPATFGLPSPSRIFVVADFNNDTLPDVAIAEDATSSVQVLLGTPGALTFKPLPPVSIGPLPRGMAVADFNLDGKVDLVSVSAGELDVFQNVGGGMLAPAFTRITSLAFSSVAIMEHPSGVPDIIVGSATDSQVFVFGNQSR